LFHSPTIQFIVSSAIKLSFRYQHTRRRSCFISWSCLPFLYKNKNST